MAEQPIQIQERLISIDALRGLAMFLILSIDIGGAPVLPTFAQLWGEKFGNLVSSQFSYASTEGMRICFLAMPMFLFVVGLVIPLSMSKRLAQQPNSRSNIYLHIIKRALILFLLGLIAGGHLLDLKFATMPLYNNVLEYIGIGYLVCAIIVLNTTWAFQLILTVGLLVAYWLAFLVIPVPGSNARVFSSQMNLAIYIDNVLLGPFHKPGSWQVLATINFIANMLIGVLMGQILNHSLDKKCKAKLLVACALAMLMAGLAWAEMFPIIRNLWSSSFVLVTCGMTTLILSALYLIIDILGYQKWGFIFVVFGVNSISIYMMAHLFDFRLIGNVFVGGVSGLFEANVREFIQASAAMTVMWLISFWMYRTKTFIKI
jgi:predicted acyltransferase